MENSVLASSLKPVKHLAVFEKMLLNELEKVNLSNLLPYMFDTIDSSVLDLLAEQFDMLGYNGWLLATSETEKRNLLKGALKLHKMKGTAGGIREVIKRLGFKDIIIEEGWDQFTDGSEEPAENSWAYFRVVYVLSDTRPISEEDNANLVGLINAYKNVRSILANFSYRVESEDKASILDEVTLNIIQA